MFPPVCVMKSEAILNHCGSILISTVSKQRSRGTPCDRPLRIQLRSSRSTAAESNARVAAPARRRLRRIVDRVLPRTRFEIMFVKNLIQSRVKRMRGSPRQVVHRDPHRRLIGLPPRLPIVIGDSLVPGSIVSNPIQCRADTGSFPSPAGTPLALAASHRRCGVSAVVRAINRQPPSSPS